MGDWLFGCDVCQEVCPWNRKAPRVEQPEFHPAAGMNPVDLAELFRLADEDIRGRFRHTPLWRAKRRGLLRNAAIVLGNQRAIEAIDALAAGLNDAEPLVRAACAWALGQIGTDSTTQILQQRLADERDAVVREEINIAMQDSHFG